MDAKESFYSGISWLEACEQILENLPEIAFWVKDLSGRFTLANSHFVKMSGQKATQDLLGKTDFHIWPRHLAESYVQDDLKVIRTGSNIKNRVELILNSNGTTSWYSTTKFPIRGQDGKIAGSAGFTTNLKKVDANLQPILKMAPAMNHMINYYTQNIEIKELADLMKLSISAFERKFKKYFNETPLKYLNRLRLDAACQLLINTDLSVSEIALKTGFYDQSHFSRQFIQNRGISPSKYRKQYITLPA